jgi:hypothetical protein
MKKTNPIYFFVVLFALMLVISIAVMLFITDVRYLFLIGFILLLVLVLGMTSIALSNGTLKRRTTLYKECIECNQEIESNSDFCQYCGATQEATVICDFCGEKNNKKETVCQHCNALLK